MAISISRNSLAIQIKIMLPMLIIAGLAISFDQLTKATVRKAVGLGGRIEVIKGYFEISYAQNTGAAFGMFRGQNRIFIIVSFFAIGFIFLYYRQFRESTWMKISLGLILGGALGNLIDRLVFHYVTDFIRVGLRNAWWPSFNIADASVCIGAVMLILGMIRRSKSVSE